MNGNDIALITNTLNSCMVAMDNGDTEWFADCYTEDGECTIIKANATKTGRDELKGLCSFLYSKFSHCKHWEGNISVRSCESINQCTNISYWKAISDNEIVSTGIHRDVLVKCDNEWKIKSRVIEHTYSKPI